MCGEDCGLQIPGSVVTALVAAPLAGISTASWFTLDGVRELAVAYGDAILAGIGWGLFGAAIALLLRGLLPTLGVLLVWFFPFENILHTRWSQANNWFPGLLLQGIRPGTVASSPHVAVTLGGYLVVVLAVAAWSFSRRDVTA